jgi:leader peptidase (prepilin peptidase) / N-methyltransferase
VLAGLVAFFAFLIGLATGSFLNVCIVRLPRGESLVWPGSHCPVCLAPIRPYDNIPALSYLLLRGRCRACRAPIALLYPLVELLTGLLFLGCWLRFGFTLEMVKWAIFAAILVTLVFTDLRERILPDAINFPGMAIGLLLSLVVPMHDGTFAWLFVRLAGLPLPHWSRSPGDALLGMAAGAGTLWIVAEGYYRLRHREGLGRGDIKMMAMAGTFLGVQRTLFTVLAGSLLGSLIGGLAILLWHKGADYELPFGGFLGAGAVIAIFLSTPFLNWYQSLWVLR